MNTIRRALLVCLVTVFAFTHLGCQNDRKIIDQHQRMLEDEED